MKFQISNFEFVMRAAAAAAALLVSSGVLCGGSVTGMVQNGTTGKPGAGLDVILLQLQGGMQPVATTKTDTHGNFHFDRPEIGGSPMLLRVPYRGVNYHQPLPPGASTAQIQIYEPTDKASSVAVTQRIIILQPNDANLLVGEEYTIENRTHPPVAFYRPDGTFEFTLPDSGHLNQVAAWGSSAMPVVQGTIDKGKNRAAIAFAFRPGENGVRISYQVPYAANQAKLVIPSDYATPRVTVAVPRGVQVNGEGFSPAGSEQGWNVFVRDAVPAGVKLAVNVSGSAPVASAASGSEDAQNPSVNSRAREADETATALPARLDSLKWILVAGFAGLFLLGGLYLWRRPQLASATGGSAASTSAPPVRGEVSAARTVEKEVQGSLDGLKDILFRLELRHQAGTIGEDDYLRERGRIEKTLRDLVKG